MGGGYSHGKGISPTPDRDPSPEANSLRKRFCCDGGREWYSMGPVMLAVHCSVPALLWPCLGPEWCLFGPVVALCWTCFVLFGLVLVSFGPEVVPFRPCFWPDLRDSRMDTPCLTNLQVMIEDLKHGEAHPVVDSQGWHVVGQTAASTVHAPTPSNTIRILAPNSWQNGATIPRLFSFGFRPLRRVPPTPSWRGQTVTRS